MERDMPIPYRTRRRPRADLARTGPRGLGFGDYTDLSTDIPDFSYDQPTTVDEITVTASPGGGLVDSGSIVDFPTIDQPIWGALDLSTALPNFTSTPGNPIASAATGIGNLLKKLLSGVSVGSSAARPAAGGASAGSALAKPATVAGAKANPAVMLLAAGGGLALLALALSSGHHRRRR